MRMKLAYKLFGALFLILILVFGALGALRYLVARNFKDFIRQVEIQRLSSIAPLLREAYRTDNGWSAIENNARYWRKLIRREMNAPGFPRPVPRSAVPRGALQPPGKKPEHVPPRRRLRYMLSDARLKPIIGHPQPGDERQLVAIEVDGKTVGWLGLAQRPRFEKGPPEVFIKQQIQQLYILGGVVVVITAVVALLLTRHLLTPVKRLARGTRELTDRNFSIRIPRTGRDELGQQADNFNTMAETLENYENMRRQWLTDISHELRTPLAVLRGEIESLLDGVRQPTPENLASLHTEVLRVNRLVEDLYLLSMADSNALQLNLYGIHIFPTVSPYSFHN